MVKNVGDGFLLPEMKDCISKVQNLVSTTNGKAWATAFAEVSERYVSGFRMRTIILILLAEPRPASKH